MTTKFHNLRIHSNWKPRFIVVGNTLDAACSINFIHKDFPRYVESTERRLKFPLPIGIDVQTKDLKIIHRRIFGGSSSFQPGSFRQTNVLVGDHRPPDFSIIDKLMLELSTTPITNLQDLLDWYFDFETVHPFLDGNGRVGGVIVAMYSKVLTGTYVVPDEGWSCCEHCQN